MVGGDTHPPNDEEGTTHAARERSTRRNARRPRPLTTDLRGKAGLTYGAAIINRSASETAVAVLARTDPNEQESVVLLPQLDGVTS